MGNIMISSTVGKLCDNLSKFRFSLVHNNGQYRIYVEFFSHIYFCMDFFINYSVSCLTIRQLWQSFECIWLLLSPLIAFGISIQNIFLYIGIFVKSQFNTEYFEWKYSKNFMLQCYSDWVLRHARIL